MTDLTVSQRYRVNIRSFRGLQKSSLRKDSAQFQTELHKLLTEFKLIKLIINQLSLFNDDNDDGESIKEVNTNYLPFLNIDYYLGSLYQDYYQNEDAKGKVGSEYVDPIENKVDNLNKSKFSFLNYLQLLNGYKLLNEDQQQKLKAYIKGDDMGYNPVISRQEKIDNFKLEQGLNKKLTILDDYYDKNMDDNDVEDESVFEKFDEDIIKQIYLDQISLFTLHTFNNLSNITMELTVLSNRNPLPSQPTPPNSKQEQDDEFGYTTKLESLPFSKPAITELLSKQGKILQPFTITSNRQQIKNKVFGTGQVLPSMTVEEYLDYELANGKMMKDEVKDVSKEDDEDQYDSEEEIKERNWDDWKDDNPKGAGNSKANIG
ncbi:TAP42-like protein [Scheffersomyces coipomensis]|uniref:TAP42-like protein n=1 Tax=Scheffersomyces coipomensis TaxID=1788519 RepID=UPI00315D2C66